MLLAGFCHVRIEVAVVDVRGVRLSLPELVRNPSPRMVDQIDMQQPLDTSWSGMIDSFSGQV